jgi:diamine N-acetyltransferase
VEIKIDIRKADMADLKLLHETSRLAYAENFGHHWKEGGLEWYLEHEYGLEKIKSGLCNPDIEYDIAFCNKRPAGFMKLHMNPNLSAHVPRPVMEIEKIYVRPAFHNMGLGRALMDTALKLAKKYHKDNIWLSVIDTNLSAILFYQKAGFTFINKSTLDFPLFRDELRGMWNMIRTI